MSTTRDSASLMRSVLSVRYVLVRSLAKSPLARELHLLNCYCLSAARVEAN